MKTRIIIIFTCAFLPLFSFSQSREKPDDIVKLENGLKEICKKGKIDNIDNYYQVNVNDFKKKNKVLELNILIANCLKSNYKFKESINYYVNALNYVGNNENKKIEINSLLSSCYYEIRDFNNTKICAELAIKRLYENKSLKVFFIEALCNLGRVFTSEGDANKALGYLEKALSLARKESDNSLTIPQIYSEIGKCYDLLGQYDKALITKNNALKAAISKLKKESKDIVRYQNDIALTYQKKGECLKAIEIYKNSLKSISEIKNKDHALAAETYIRMGNCYYYLEDHSKAANFFLKTTEILIHQFNWNLQSIGENLTKAGASYTNLGLFSEAAVLIDSALVVVGFDERKSLPFEQIIGSKPSLLITLYFKAKNSLQLYLKYGCEEDLERAHEEYDVCIRLIDHIISSFDDSDSKQYLVDRFYYIFESIIEVNYQFYRLRGERKYVDRAMRYMEKSRSILLKEMMQHAKAAIMTGVPDTMRAQERRLREQIAGLENRKYESERKLPAGQQGDVVFHRLNDSLFILREQYWALLKQMEQRFPDYYKLKHADRSAETAAIVNRLLQPQEALVQYFVGDDHIYTLVYRGDGAYAMTKAPVGDLDQAIKALRESIYGYVLTPSDSLTKAYADGAYGLYEKLLQPVSSYLPYRVTIIPDGLLEYLPFEALLTAKADPNSSFRAWPYCLRKYSFCYAHSVLSLDEMRQRENRPKYRQVLAIAPSFSPALAVRSSEERRRSFGVLEDNLTEVAGIRDLFPAKTLVGPEATVESFKALAGDYAVLHLATHAKADNENGEYAYVAFSETNDTAHSNLLYLKSLYTLPLHADMVALSACETGVGRLRRGEGVVSLARGFSYAGANSLVTTLWRISDRESATLMQRYYQGLKNDLSKDEALRQAKINYLENAFGNRAHPFFWAAFVTIGDMEPLDLPDGSWMWWLLAGLALVGVLFWRKFSGGRGATPPRA